MDDYNSRSLPQKLRDFAEPHAFIACGGYSGLSPYASGTTGSAAAVAVWWALFQFGVLETIFSQIILFLLVTVIGTYACDHFLKSALNKSISSRKAGDPGVVVIDEWSGMFLTLINGVGDSMLYLLIAFLLFRVFDVLKPGPVNSLQALPGAWGVMLDDVGAGLLALAVLQVIMLFF